jgi:hypothetical protein
MDAVPITKKTKELPRITDHEFKDIICETRGLFDSGETVSLETLKTNTDKMAQWLESNKRIILKDKQIKSSTIRQIEQRKKSFDSKYAKIGSIQAEGRAWAAREELRKLAQQYVQELYDIAKTNFSALRSLGEKNVDSELSTNNGAANGKEANEREVLAIEEVGSFVEGFKAFTAITEEASNQPEIVAEGEHLDHARMLPAFDRLKNLKWLLETKTWGDLYSALKKAEDILVTWQELEKWLGPNNTEGHISSERLEEWINLHGQQLWTNCSRKFFDLMNLDQLNASLEAESQMNFLRVGNHGTWLKRVKNEINLDIFREAFRSQVEEARTEAFKIVTTFTEFVRKEMGPFKWIKDAHSNIDAYHYELIAQGFSQKKLQNYSSQLSDISQLIRTFEAINEISNNMSGGQSTLKIADAQTVGSEHRTWVRFYAQNLLTISELAQNIGKNSSKIVEPTNKQGEKVCDVINRLEGEKFVDSQQMPLEALGNEIKHPFRGLYNSVVEEVNRLSKEANKLAATVQDLSPQPIMDKHIRVLKMSIEITMQTMNEIREHMEKRDKPIRNDLRVCRRRNTLAKQALQDINNYR